MKTKLGLVGAVALSLNTATPTPAVSETVGSIALQIMNQLNGVESSILEELPEGCTYSYEPTDNPLFVEKVYVGESCEEIHEDETGQN